MTTPRLAPEPTDADLAHSDVVGAALTIARRFHAGSAMWCVAPLWEPQAHHVAAAFADPAGTDAPSLPASALTAPDAVAQARDSVHPGDILVAVAAADDATVRELMHRCAAWGARSVWIGAGQRPPGGSADHVLWIDEPLATGRFVLLYRRLRELTQHFLGRPELLVDPGECTDEVCITCSDEGRLAEVIAPGDGALGQTLARTAKGIEHIDTTLVAPVRPNDLVLVHAGLALTRVGAE